MIDALSIRVLLVTNTLTPYREYMFAQMYRAFRERSIALDVWIMSSGDAYHRWNYSEGDLTFPARIFGPAPRMWHNIPMHFAPRLLADMIRQRWDVIIVGGYASPAHILATLIARRKTKCALWTEGNVDAIQRKHGWAPRLKRFAIEQCDAFIVPQTKTRDMIVSIAPDTRLRRFIILPNIIDDEVYGDGVTKARRNRLEVRRELNVPDDRQFWLITARLSREKGLVEFLSGMQGTAVHIVIAGDGPLRREIQALVARKNLPVTLCGNCDQSRIVTMLGAADVFALPSLWDSSPLAPIEAACAGLPLLLSSSIGNIDDVLEEGVNGWSFNPRDALDLARATHEVSSASFDTLRFRGAASRARYETRFDTKRVLRELAHQIELLAGKTGVRNALEV